MESGIRGSGSLRAVGGGYGVCCFCPFEKASMRYFPHSHAKEGEVGKVIVSLSGGLSVRGKEGHY